MQYVGMEVITCGNGTASSRVPPDLYCSWAYYGKPPHCSKTFSSKNMAGLVGGCWCPVWLHLRLSLNQCLASKHLFSKMGLFWKQIMLELAAVQSSGSSRVIFCKERVLVIKCGRACSGLGGVDKVSCPRTSGKILKKTQHSLAWILDLGMVLTSSFRGCKRQSHH